MKEEIAEVKSWAVAPEPQLIAPEDAYREVPRAQPYKVIPIDKIIPDAGKPEEPGAIKKIYQWIWRTFKSKDEAMNYLAAVQKRNPWMQYDIFPV